MAFFRVGHPGRGVAGRGPRGGADRSACRAAIGVVAWLLAGAGSARAQGAPWKWFMPDPSAATAQWSPEAFADFLSSGQPPHPAVVRIVAPEGGGTSIGSGVLVDVNATQGLVLTNWHVIRGATSAVLVQFPDGFQTAGRVIRHDEPWDLAAVAIWRPRAVPVPISPQPPVIGEPLTIAGYGKGPFRSEAGPCTQYLAPGTGYPLEFVELAATARQGDSGGPILNARGELAGILFGRAEGRTIGACSTRVQTFLAGIGSRGLTAAEAAALAAAAAPPAAPMAAAASAGPGAVVPSVSLPRPGDAVPDAPLAGPPPGEPALLPAETAGAPPAAPPPEGPEPVPAFTAAGSPPPMAPPPPAWGDLPEGRPEGRTLGELFDPTVNARALVVTGGGLLLALVGVRTIFGRGGRPAPPRRRFVEIDDE